MMIKHYNVKFKRDKVGLLGKERLLVHLTCADQ